MRGRTPEAGQPGRDKPGAEVATGRARQHGVRGDPLPGFIRLPMLLARALEVEIAIIEAGAQVLATWARVGWSGTTFGEVVRSAIIRLGPVPIKVGQIVATRRDILPGEMCDALGELHDRVPAEPVPAARASLSRELGASAGRFSRLTPLAGASVASLYTAVVDGERHVAVKLLRTGVTARMTTDFELLEILAAAAERFPALASVPIRSTLAAIREMVETQSRLDLEARAVEQLRPGLALAEVKVPQVLLEFATSGCLVLELVADLRPCSSANTLPAEVRSRLAATGLRALYWMIFTEGLIHADLHPGNVGWLPGPPATLVVLDFGLVARLTPRDRADFARFFLAMAAGNGHVCASVILATAVYAPAGLDTAKFTAEVSDVVARHWALDASTFNVARFVADLFDIQRRHRIAGSVAFITTIVALLAFEGTLRTLDPRLDFQAEARSYFSTQADPALLRQLLVSSINASR